MASLSQCHQTFLLAIILPSIYAISMASMPTIMAAVCNKDDQDNLLLIKQSFGSPSYLSSWDADTTNCCSGWKGVQCTSGRVTKLDVSGTESVNGSIPPEIGKLSSLQSLTLQHLPNLRGRIPSLIELSKLINLTISHTSVISPLPPLGRMIRILTLSHNYLIDTLPDDFPDQLPFLVMLDISHNHLFGRIPTSFSKFQFLYKIVLRHNTLSEELPHFQSKYLFEVDVSNNFLNGNISAVFGARSNLGSLNISRNAFNFDLSTVVFPTSLFYLDFSHNLISGKIPSQLTQLKNLLKFDVSFNFLCGKIPVQPNMGRAIFEGAQGRAFD